MVHVREFVESIHRTYTGLAYGLTLLSGLLLVMGERYLFARRGYRREAAVCAFFGWLYVAGGTLAYLALIVLAQLVL